MVVKMERVLDTTKGLIEFYIRKGNSDWVLESQQNLIVSNARKILRDLVIGEIPESNGVKAPTISFLVLGDMGMTLEESSSGVPEPLLEDKVLKNPLLWVPVRNTEDNQWPNNRVSAVEYKGLNAIKYEFFIGRDQGNVPGGFFNELGLAISKTTAPDAYLFSKLNRRTPLLKDNDTELLLNYYIMF